MVHLTSRYYFEAWSCNNLQTARARRKKISRLFLRFDRRNKDNETEEGFKEAGKEGEGEGGVSKNRFYSRMCRQYVIAHFVGH